MNICNCPKCNCGVSYSKLENSHYVISCKKCHDNGVIIEAHGNTLEEAIKKWNDRPLIKLFLRDIDFTYKYLQGLNGNLEHDMNVDNTINKGFGGIFLNDCNYLGGWIITKQCEIFQCIQTHEDLIFDILKIDTTNLTREQKAHLADIAVKNGLIRITFFGRTLAIDFNKSIITKKIKDTLITLLYDNLSSYIKNIREFIFSDIKTNKIDYIYNFNDVIIYIDSL